MNLAEAKLAFKEGLEVETINRPGGNWPKVGTYARIVNIVRDVITLDVRSPGPYYPDELKLSDRPIPTEWDSDFELE